MIESQSNRYHVGRGLEVIGQRMWLGDGEDNIQFAVEVDNEITDLKWILSAKWQLRWRKLAEHLYYIHHQ